MFLHGLRASSMVVFVFMAVFKAHLVLLFKEPDGFVDEETADGQNDGRDAGAFDDVAPALRRDVLQRVKESPRGRQPGDDDEEDDPASDAPFLERRGSGGVIFVELAVEQDTAEEP